MTTRTRLQGTVFFCLLALFCTSTQSLAAPREPIPDRLVVLTFDDSVASHYSVVRPLLKELGFGATFFITEGFSFRTNKRDYMTWEQIAELHRDGFEIGNHTRDHLGVSDDTLGMLRGQVEPIQSRCAEHGIPPPTSFAYPGNAITPRALSVLRELGFKFARRGGAPEHPYDWGRGFAYEPGRDHPLLIPSAGDARPDWTIADFQRAVTHARDGRIAVLQFHGAPDREHPWVHTAPERFVEFMRYLKTNQFHVIAVRDLARYVDPEFLPDDPLAVVEERRRQRSERLVEGEVRDADSGEAVAARVYIRGADGSWHFPKSASFMGSAVRYERRHSANPRSVEMHTAVSAHPFRVELAPGRYTVTVERGKEWHPVSREIVVEGEPVKFSIELRRWADMATHGWYSGDTHVHRALAELGTPMLAEDVNVVLPMTDWTTDSAVTPIESPQSIAGDARAEPAHVDATHVWFPRNTEYEIFRVDGRNHTQGAFLVLGHTSRFDAPVYPLREVARRARQQGALLDLEKHNWPWSLTILPLLQVDLFELANNHHWQTEYGLRGWAVPAPAWMNLPGTGADTERDWTLYGFQTWYTLLNCGFALRPTAGTAHGVHPVPLGFSRVYVHLDGDFSFDGWMKGLNAGRSFVTTGPFLLVQANGQHPGSRFTHEDNEPFKLRLEGEVLSSDGLHAIEFVRNGDLVRSIPVEGESARGRRTFRFAEAFDFESSGWMAVRCWERRDAARMRFAHTAAWFVDVPRKPLRPRRHEVAWCVERVEEEIARNRRMVPPAAMDEYEASLRAWKTIAESAE
jgi:peptidoglycan/xylan/chitin deacetylase (PgdA/CDA1 family)